MKRLVFLYSHPIQYLSPLSRLAHEEGTFDVWTIYCSPQGVQPVLDKEFTQIIKWDIPILEGYRSVFLKNWRGSRRGLSGFWSLVNPSIVGWLWSAPRGILVVHGWAYFTHVLAIVCGKIMGYRVVLRGESNWRHERLLPWWKRQLKRLVLGKGLFQFVDYFLFIGIENRRFYEQIGVPPHRLLFAPYGVDNSRFSAQWMALREKKADLRRQLGLPERAQVVLFSGKLIPKKRPLDLLEAFALLKTFNVFLVYVGDGPLRPALEVRARALGLAESMRIEGFVNQSAIGLYYAAADVFVMCSGVGETWGLSTNEAMNFALPIVLSDLTGCAADLCRFGVNGFVFPTGDVEALAAHLRYLLALPSELRQAMGEASRTLVAAYNYQEVLASLKKISQHT
ncbi:MAG: glycosyltransferase family 4 protein [Saprospiraceae bacterium]|nr:glycosyltransferase family 4 protein [Saprospiraceae bacterium]MDW8483794.1 glycosyltransferase family 4 protein [Saprospiraceae bacterium]